jgi:hypothetical protein
MVRPPKYESKRTIYLPDELVAILSEHVRQHTPKGEPDRWLFDEDGKPWHDNLVDYRWRSTRTDAHPWPTVEDKTLMAAFGMAPAVLATSPEFTFD